MLSIGIDLGTTNSVVCVYQKGMTEIIQIDGKTTVPSVVYFDNKTIKIGEKAKKQVLIHPELTLSSMKRHMGKKYSQKILHKNFTPVDVAYHILSYLKNESEKILGEHISNVVITIPAYFDDQQRKDTKDAAERAGLNVLRLIPEPTAAAIAYGLDKEKDQQILVFDLGGGTFDVSILDVQNNNFTVKSVDGNSKLGGDDFDNEIVNYLNDWIENNSNQSARGNSHAQQRLKEEAEKIKIDLSQSKYTSISIPAILEGIDIEIEKFTRKDFQKLLHPYLKEIVKKTNDVMLNTGMSIEDINRIVMVGGSSKNPLIQELITDNFKMPYRADDMDSYVARGAAIICARLLLPVEPHKNNLPIDLNFSDVIPHSLGVGLLNESDQLTFFPILKRNEAYPKSAAVLAIRAYIAQEIIRIQIFRGENNNPTKNTPLGAIEMVISKEYIGVDIPLVFPCVFELDENGILTFTAFEIPVNPSNKEEMKELLEEYGNNDRVSFQRIQSLQKKYNYRTQRIKVTESLQ